MLLVFLLGCRVEDDLFGGWEGWMRVAMHCLFGEGKMVSADGS